MTHLTLNVASTCRSAVAMARDLYRPTHSSHQRCFSVNLDAVVVRSASRDCRQSLRSQATQLVRQTATAKVRSTSTYKPAISNAHEQHCDGRSLSYKAKRCPGRGTHIS